MFKTLSTITILGLLTITGAQAQSSQRLQANVPFAFHVQHKDYAAGTYRLAYSGESHILYLRGMEQGSQSGYAIAWPANETREPSTDGKLIFHCYKNACDLAEIWPSAETGGAGLQFPHNDATRRVSFSVRTISMASSAK